MALFSLTSHLSNVKNIYIFLLWRWEVHLDGSPTMLKYPGTVHPKPTPCEDKDKRLLNNLNGAKLMNIYLFINFGRPEGIPMWYYQIGLVPQGARPNPC